MIKTHHCFSRILNAVIKLTLLSILLVTVLSACNSFGKSPRQIWVGTWGTSPQLVEPHNMPPEPGLTNNTLRQIVRISIGGDSLRVRFSNEFSTSPVTLKAVQIALSAGNGAIDSLSIAPLTFGKLPDVTMQPGTAITSDALYFPVKPRTDLAITIYFGETSPDVTGHPGSRTTSYLKEGNQINDAQFANANTADRWYVIQGIDVKAPETAGAIVTLGNSITDGRGSGTNMQNRWPDILAERLLQNPATSNVAVINQGIGGNCVLRTCLGPAAIERFNRDVLSQHGVRWLIILEAINDIGQTPDSITAAKVANDLIAAYSQMIDKAHEKGIRVYGATILPFKESFYYKDFRESARSTVNDWIRNGGKFDAVIDFDLALQDPENPLMLLPETHTGDYLHPNETGYRLMGEFIDLTLFENK